MDNGNKLITWMKNIFKQRSQDKPAIMETAFINQPGFNQVDQRILQPANHFNTIPKRVDKGIDVRQTVLMQQKVKQHVRQKEIHQQSSQSSHQQLNQQPIHQSNQHQLLHQPNQSISPYFQANNQPKSHQFLINPQQKLQHHQQQVNKADQSNLTHFNVSSTGLITSPPPQLASGAYQGNNGHVRINRNSRLNETQGKDRRKSRPRRCQFCGHQLNQDPSTVNGNPSKTFNPDYPNYDPKPQVTISSDWRNLDYDSHPSHPPQARHQLKTQFKTKIRTIKQQQHNQWPKERRPVDSDCESCLFTSRGIESVHYNTPEISSTDEC